MLKVAVIGAGFSGLIFSKYLLKSNIEVDLYEEHDKVGIPEHCTGIVSATTTNLIGQISRKSIVKEFKGVKLLGIKKGIPLITSKPIIKLDRVRLEADLLNDLRDKGGRVFLNKRVKGLSALSNYDVIILADGINGYLHKSVGIGFHGRRIYGVNQEFCMENNEEYFEVKFDPVTSNNFFSWFVPLGEKIIIGTGAEKMRKLKDAQRNAREYFGIKSKECKTYGGIIISGVDDVKLRTGKIIGVGDAIGLTKPLTGGGLYPNSLSAYLMHKLILKGHNIIESLEAALVFTFGLLHKSKSISLLMQRRPEVIDEIIEIAEKHNIIKQINGRIDYDLHFDLIQKAFESDASTAFVRDFLKKYPLDFFRLAFAVIKDLK